MAADVEYRVVLLEVPVVDGKSGVTVVSCCKEHGDMSPHRNQSNRALKLGLRLVDSPVRLGFCGGSLVGWQ